MRSAAASVYELAPETLADSDVESRVTAATNSHSNDHGDSGNHEISNEDEYAAVVQMSMSRQSQRGGGQGSNYVPIRDSSMSSSDHNPRPRDRSSPTFHFCMRD
ncbi:unnamed protein product [Mortierella alpina]